MSAVAFNPLLKHLHKNLLHDPTILRHTCRQRSSIDQSANSRKVLSPRATHSTIKRSRPLASSSCRRTMSGYYYADQTSQSEDEFDFDPSFHQGPQPSPFQQYSPFAGQALNPPATQAQVFSNPPQFYQQPQVHQQQPQFTQAHQYPGYQQPHQSSLPQQYGSQFDFQATPLSPFVTPTVPSNYHYDTQSMTPFPQYTDPSAYDARLSTAGPSTAPAGYLSPDEASRPRMSRAASYASNRSYSHSDVSVRSTSPNLSEMQRWGFQNSDGTWSCRYPGCASKSRFNRGCDLRKHYKRHTKSLFCRVDGCPQATTGGFSSKKDRARHEAKHNPGITCEWEGCDRLFSRMDNMVRELSTAPTLGHLLTKAPEGSRPQSAQAARLAVRAASEPLNVLFVRFFSCTDTQIKSTFVSRDSHSFLLRRRA